MSVAESFDQRVGAYLRDARVALRLSQREVAEKLSEVGLNIGPTAVTRIEKGSRSVGLEEAVALAEVLDLSLEGIFYAAHDDAERFAKMQQRAEEYMLATRDKAWGALALLQEIRNALSENPSFLPVPAESYFQWVLDRMPEVRSRTRWHVRIDPDERSVGLLQLLANALVAEIAVQGKPNDQDPHQTDLDAPIEPVGIIVHSDLSGYHPGAPAQEYMPIEVATDLDREAGRTRHGEHSEAT